ncbi:MAG: TraR/DksA C4-type zinc finger protein, partial [Candidatus Binatia bacterium]|nr:TraR/DksA C4-type zinc finger protein [Candidatus Binatia bacterium]
SGREREKLLAIDDALQRIEEKSYGMCECGCENCDSEIGMGRLKVLPFTRLCVRCQEEREKESKLLNKMEEERGYRRISTSDVEDDNP